MAYKGETPLEMDDDWGYPYFRKPPYGDGEKPIASVYHIWRDEMPAVFGFAKVAVPGCQDFAIPANYVHLVLTSPSLNFTTW